jgi:DNA-binding NarL/FixJ family response regulator
MTNRRVLVSTRSRWLGEMLGRAVSKAPKLELVNAAPGRCDLDITLAASHSDWLILDHAPGKGRPDSIDDILSRHPGLRILVITDDGATARVERYGATAEWLDDVSLTHIISRLRDAADAQ